MGTDSQTVGLGRDRLSATGSKGGLRMRNEVVVQDWEVKVQAGTGREGREEVRNKAGRR